MGPTEITVSAEVAAYWKGLAPHLDRTKFPTNEPYEVSDVVCYQDGNYRTIAIVDEVVPGKHVTGFRLFGSGFPCGSRFKWEVDEKTHCRLGSTALLWRKGRVCHALPGLIPNPPLPIIPGSHDRSNPYLFNRTHGIQCNNCGAFPSDGPVYCTPIQGWRLEFERSLVPPDTKPKTPVKWTGYKAPGDLLQKALQEPWLCGMSRPQPGL